MAVLDMVSEWYSFSFCKRVPYVNTFRASRLTFVLLAHEIPVIVSRTVSMIELIDTSQRILSFCTLLCSTLTCVCHLSAQTPLLQHNESNTMPFSPQTHPFFLPYRMRQVKPLSLFSLTPPCMKDNSTNDDCIIELKGRIPADSPPLAGYLGW